MKKYGIEQIGYGKRRCYCIKEIIPNAGGLRPVDYKRYKTEQDARNAAEALGLKAECVGDFWALLS